MNETIRYVRGQISLGRFIAATSDRGLVAVAEAIEHPESASDLAVDLRGSAFELRVWTALREIPAGETIGYGALATRLGVPRDAREVAAACAANTLAVLVPCHRVVRKNGSISGYRWGFRRKRALIDRERRGDGHSSALRGQERLNVSPSRAA